VPLAELVSRQQQMQRLLDKMAGMVGQYFLPKMEGVRISMVAPAGTAYLVEGARQGGRLLAAGATAAQQCAAEGFAQGKLQLQGEILRLTPGCTRGSDPSPQIARMKKERLALLFCG
jgi:hypothetical protein